MFTVALILLFLGHSGIGSKSTNIQLVTENDMNQDKDRTEVTDRNRIILDRGKLFRIMKVARRNFEERNDLQIPLTDGFRNIKLKVNSNSRKNKSKSPVHNSYKGIRKNRQIYRGDYISHIKQKARPQLYKENSGKNVLRAGSDQVALGSILQPQHQLRIEGHTFINPKESLPANLHKHSTLSPLHTPPYPSQSLPYHPTTPLPQYGPIHGYNYATRHSYVQVQFGRERSYPHTQQQKQPNTHHISFPPAAAKKVNLAGHTSRDLVDLHKRARENIKLNSPPNLIFKPTVNLINKTPHIISNDTERPQKGGALLRFETEPQKKLKVRFEEPGQSEEEKMVRKKKVIFPEA